MYLLQHFVLVTGIIFPNKGQFYKFDENLPKNRKLLFSNGFFPGFPGFSRREIGEFSRFPAGNSNTGKCATLISSTTLKLWWFNDTLFIFLERFFWLDWLENENLWDLQVIHFSRSFLVVRMVRIMTSSMESFHLLTQSNEDISG